MGELLFWGSVAVIAYVYLFYPVALVLSALVRRPRRIVHDDHRPTVTIIVAAHNEAPRLAARLDNLLALDYPVERLQIIVASDGSTDGTAALVAGYGDRGVLLLDCPEHPGKTVMQNRAAALACGEVLVFTDANTRYAPEAVRLLVRHFADPAIGAVGGQLRYTRPGAGAAGHGELLYWRYENFLKRQEGETGSLIGVNGAIYAVRRSLYRQLDAHLMSDLAISLRIREFGCRTVFEPAAVATEQVYESTGTTFAVKRRIILRALTTIRSESRFLNPLRFKFYAVKLFSHKLLRWLVPVFLLTLLAGNLLLAGQPLYRITLAGQALFYTGGLLGLLMERQGLRSPLFFIPFYFCLVNGAALAALADFLRGRRIVTWQPRRP